MNWGFPAKRKFSLMLKCMPRYFSPILVQSIDKVGHPSRASGLCVLALAALLAACGWQVSAPEARAQEYVEALVLDPDNTEVLKIIANNPAAPESLVQGLDARVALDYLCARHKQGVNLYFAHTDVRRPEPDRRQVVVLTSQADGSSAGKEVRFEIDLEKNGPQAWRITRISAGG
jgi:hypothetical protein